MRKIVSKSEEEKNKKRNQFIVGGVLIAVMLFSTLGYAFQGNSEEKTKKLTYNGFDFIEKSGYWFLEIGQMQFAFKYNPKQVERIDSEINKINEYSAKPLYISSKYQEAYSEIYINLNPLVQRMQFACEENKTCAENLPVKGCDSNFIIIEESNETNITQQGNCVFIKSPIGNLTQTTDEFLFKMLNIENE